MRYVTCVSFSHSNLAVAAVFSFVATQEFDRLTIVTDDGSVSGAGRNMFRTMMADLAAIDGRIELVDARDIVRACAEPATERLLANPGADVLSPGHLRADALRSYLYPWFGRPVAWFDVDMLFLRDTSAVFDLADKVACAAAPDHVGTLGDAHGTAVHQRFTAFCRRREPGAAPLAEARNIGFMLLAADVRQQYAESLWAALRFLHQEPDPIASFSVGQLAWNHTMTRVASTTLDLSYNTPSVCLGPITADSATGPGAPRVRHYIGVEEKKRMTLDFALLMAGARLPVRPAAVVG